MNSSADNLGVFSAGGHPTCGAGAAKPGGASRTVAWRPSGEEAGEPPVKPAVEPKDE